MSNLRKAGGLLVGLCFLGGGYLASDWYLNRETVHWITFAMRTGNISDYERGCIASSQRIEQVSKDRLKWAKENEIKPRPVVVRYSRVMKAGLSGQQYRDECLNALIEGGSVNFENRSRMERR
jgi:hypothetical protein